MDIIEIYKTTIYFLVIKKGIIDIVLIMAMLYGLFHICGLGSKDCKQCEKHPLVFFSLIIPIILFSRVFFISFALLITSTYIEKKSKKGV